MNLKGNVNQFLGTVAGIAVGANKMGLKSAEKGLGETKESLAANEAATAKNSFTQTKSGRFKDKSSGKFISSADAEKRKEALQKLKDEHSAMIQQRDEFKQRVEKFKSRDILGGMF